MMPLLWKEYRNNFGILMLGLGLLVLPFLVTPILLYSTASGAADRSWVEFKQSLWAGLFAGGFISLGLTQFSMLCLGGQVISGERSSQTAEFLFYLPPSRTTIISCKLIFCVAFAALSWVFASSIILVVENFVDLPKDGMPQKSLWFAEIAAVGLMLFGSAWFVSSRSESPVLAMGMGALATLLVGILVRIVQAKTNLTMMVGESDFTRVFAFSLLGVVGVIAGSFLFARRVEP